MTEDISVHIRSCKRCMHFKQPQERAEMTPITASYPLELVQLDFLTKGTKNDSGKNANVLAITDHFTRYAVAYVTLKPTALIVAKALWENFLVNYGWPEKILTDQGKTFESSLIKELCELAGVEKLRTTPYHPEMNGQCEHFNWALTNMIGTHPNPC